MSNFKHVSILLNECIEGLAINPDGVYVDGTLGGAGHSFHIAQKLSKNGRLICIDRDDMALENAKIRLADFLDRIIFVKSNFSEIDEAVKGAGFDGVDGILFDLGVSSPQLDIAERGFSYMADAPLDMRMDRTQAKTAFDVVNTYERGEILRILRDYGEEKFASAIASKIVAQREIQPIKTTLELVEVIKSAMPAKAKKEKQHPAKRSFQAIRIAVNDELSSVELAMEKSIELLNAGGRLCVITFHSLEDRIVKSAYNKGATGCTCPSDFPICVCGKSPKVKFIKKKPILPTEEEIEENPRARSAKLRICEKN